MNKYIHRKKRNALEDYTINETRTEKSVDFDVISYNLIYYKNNQPVEGRSLLVPPMSYYKNDNEKVPIENEIYPYNEKYKYYFTDHPEPMMKYSLKTEYLYEMIDTISSPLMDEIRMLNVEKVKELISRGVDVNGPPIFLACMVGNLQILKLLLENTSSKQIFTGVYINRYLFLTTKNLISTSLLDFSIDLQEFHENKYRGDIYKDMIDLILKKNTFPCVNFNIEIFY